MTRRYLLNKHSRYLLEPEMSQEQWFYCVLTLVNIAIGAISISI